MVPKDVVRSGKFIFASGPIIISLVLVLLTCMWLFAVHVSKFSKRTVSSLRHVTWSSSERVESSTTMEQPTERSLMRTRNDRAQPRTLGHTAHQRLPRGLTLVISDPLLAVR